LLLLPFLIWSNAYAEEFVVKIYPEEGAGGLTSEGRTFEDRYADWFQTIDKDGTRKSRSDIYTI